MVNENNFEGSLVLEKLAEIGKVDEFYEAIDSDDFVKMKKLMRMASIDEEMIRSVFEEIEDQFKI